MTDYKCSKNVLFLLLSLAQYQYIGLNDSCIMLMPTKPRPRGFTIVELLIVVVIIAILAAITLVTYSGIQQRATNAAIVDAASKSVRLVQAYIAANSNYPLSASVCVTVDTGCNIPTIGAVSGNTTFNTNMATVGSLPKSVPAKGATNFGVTYTFSPGRTVNGSTFPVMVDYFLDGASQQCGLSNIIVYTGTGEAWTTTSSGYTDNSMTDKTRCRISVMSSV